MGFHRAGSPTCGELSTKRLPELRAPSVASASRAASWLEACGADGRHCVSGCAAGSVTMRVARARVIGHEGGGQKHNPEQSLLLAVSAKSRPSEASCAPIDSRWAGRVSWKRFPAGKLRCPRWFRGGRFGKHDIVRSARLSAGRAALCSHLKRSRVNACLHATPAARNACPRLISRRAQAPLSPSHRSSAGDFHWPIASTPPRASQPQR